MVLLFMVLETTFISNERSQHSLAGLNLNENAPKLRVNTLHIYTQYSYSCLQDIAEN